MTSMKLVFPDRGTISLGVEIPTPNFKHTWSEFDKTKPEQVIQRVHNCDAVITNKVVFDEGILEQCPALKYIGLTATGYNNVDLEACAKRNVVVCNVHGYSTDAVAEHVMMFILALFKRLKSYTQTLAEGAWQNAGQFTYFNEPILSLKGKRLGLVGTGSIAVAVAKIAEAFGMQPLFYSPSGRVDVEGRACVDFETLLKQSDLVSIHCPLTASTQGLFDSTAFDLMQSHAFLINTARGPIVETTALVAALKEGRIAGAGIDVLPQEPPPAMDELIQALDLPQLLVTPHTAWAGIDAQQRLMEMVIEKLNDFIAGRAVQNLADPKLVL